MAQPRYDKLITALDIGSWKVSALIAGQTDRGELTILGTGQRESRGVRRGYIADMERTEQAVRETVEQAERIAGTNIEDVWVNFSAGGLISDIASVEVELGGHRIEQQDIDDRSEEHTSELQSLMRISYAVFCLKKKMIRVRQHNVYFSILIDTTIHMNRK